jgi:hypothetical protein
MRYGKFRKKIKGQELIQDSSILEAILQNQDLPSVAEQADNLILYIGGKVQYPGKYVELKSKTDFARIGAIDGENFKFIRDKLKEKGFLLLNKEAPKITSTLSFEGWERYGELGRGRADSTKAFMAMPFGDPKINDLFNQYKEASKKAGFNLIKNDEDRKAGSVDDKIRVNILTSKFIIAELTDGNQGAYWEAGYAEGLGKPVIYSCEKPYFDNKGTHFDTNHLHTIIWERDKKEEAAEELKYTIRATLPGDSILED